MTSPARAKRRRPHGLAKGRRAPQPSAPAPKATGPAQQKPLEAWLLHHFYVFFSSLGQSARSPLSTLMTAAVLGIALALPTGLYLLLENALQVSRGWDAAVHISLFLQPEVSDAQAEALAAQVRGRGEVESVRLISKAEALKEYRELSGFSDALKSLAENPLPAVLVVKPRSAQLTQTLLDEFARLPAVDVAQYDMRWLKRLYAMMEVVQRGIWLLAGLLGLAVLLIIGNTIRLAIYNRREEIEIHKLFGATDAFIRRPFLYSGLWYGLLGSLIAWLLVQSALYALQEPVQRLAALYAGNYHLITLNWQDSFKLLALGTGLGLLGAWLAVSRHLREIRPR
jgi:cell division transport system permease protein